MKPVLVPRHNALDLAVSDISQHLLVVLPHLAVARAAVVVRVLLGLGPALLPTQLQARVALAADGQLISLGVLRLPQVNGGGGHMYMLHQGTAGSRPPASLC